MKKKSKDIKITMISNCLKSYGELPVFILLTLILSLCFRCLIGLMPNLVLIDIIDTVNEEWYINAFFDYQNKNGTPKSIEDISIIDIDDDFFSRGNLADVVKEVAKYKPKVIGIDFSFNGSKNNDSLQSVKLKNTLESLMDSVNIAVVAFKNDTVSHSYFTKELGIKYGLCNHRGFGRVELANDTIPYFSTMIAQLAGIDIKEIPSSFVVNYRNKEFNKCTIRNILEYDTITRTYYKPIDELIDVIENRIVLIGQTKNPYDMLDLPFCVNGRRQISGVEEIAYEVSSLLKHNEGIKEYVTPYTRNGYWDFFNFSLVVCVCISYFMCAKLKEKLKNRNRFFPKALLIILKLFGLLILVVVLVMLCFLLTKHYCKILDIILFATAIIVLDSAWDLTQLIVKK